MWRHLSVIFLVVLALIDLKDKDLSQKKRNGFQSAGPTLKIELNLIQIGIQGVHLSISWFRQDHTWNMSAWFFNKVFWKSSAEHGAAVFLRGYPGLCFSVVTNWKVIPNVYIKSLVLYIGLFPPNLFLMVEKEIDISQRWDTGLSNFYWFSSPKPLSF